MSDLHVLLSCDPGVADDDPFGDAIHVLAPGEYGRTLCGERVEAVAQACSMDSGYKPGLGNGCWTCLSESNRWVPDTPTEESEGTDGSATAR